MQPMEFEQSCECADKRYTDVHPLMVIDSQFGEWIALDELTIEECFKVEVGGLEGKGDSDGVAAEG